MLQIRKLPIILFGISIALFPYVAKAVPVINHYTDIMVFAGIYCLITIGLSLLLGYAGQISLGRIPDHRGDNPVAPELCAAGVCQL